MLRYSDNSFSESFLTTVGVNFTFKTIVKDSKKVKIQMWDTAGQERFRAIATSYFRYYFSQQTNTM